MHHFAQSEVFRCVTVQVSMTVQKTKFGLIKKPIALDVFPPSEPGTVADSDVSRLTRLNIPAHTYKWPGVAEAPPATPDTTTVATTTTEAVTTTSSEPSSGSPCFVCENLEDTVYSGVWDDSIGGGQEHPDGRLDARDAAHCCELCDDYASCNFWTFVTEDVRMQHKSTSNPKPRSGTSLQSLSFFRTFDNPCVNRQPFSDNLLCVVRKDLNNPKLCIMLTSINERKTQAFRIAGRDPTTACETTTVATTTTEEKTLPARPKLFSDDDVAVIAAIGIPNINPAKFGDENLDLVWDRTLEVCLVVNPG